MVLRAIVGYDGILSILGKSKHFALMYTYLLLLLLMLLLNFTFNLRKILGGGGEWLRRGYLMSSKPVPLCSRQKPG